MELEIFSKIGDVVGYPAMMLAFWLYLQVRQLTAELNSVKSDHKETVKSIEEIKGDVAYIRGFLEKNEKSRSAS